MRLVRVGPPGQERPGVLDTEGVVRDLRRVTGDIDGAFLAGPGLREARLALERGLLPPLPEGRLGPPVARPGKVVGIGLNYRCFAQAAGVATPPEPILFLKPSSSVVGPTDAIRIPEGSRRTDWEAELGVVVGSTVRGVTDPGEALAAVAGFVTANDVTERAHAEYGPTWAKGKCHDTFCPIGPWLVTPDEVDDPQNLRMQLWVNGTRRQHSSTSSMVFDIATLLAYASRHMTLDPGDLLLTGTPAGVACHYPEPRPYLRGGDLIELEVDGLGRQCASVFDT